MSWLLVNILALIFTFGIWNGYIVLWGVHKNIPNYNERRRRWSKIWHAIGFWLKIQIIAVAVHAVYLLQPELLENYLFISAWFLFAFNLSWTVYDLTINVIRYIATGHPPLLYIDDKGINAKMIDLLSERGVWIFRAIIIIINVVLFAYA